MINQFSKDLGSLTQLNLLPFEFLTYLRKKLMNQYFTYILQCSDKTLYCGYTTDLEKRLATHNSGKGRNTQKQDCQLSCLPLLILIIKMMPCLVNGGLNINLFASKNCHLSKMI